MDLFDSQVIFHDGGYKYFSKTIDTPLSEDDQHHLLFTYAEKDLTRLPILLAQYVSKKMDLITLAENDYKYTDNDRIEIEEMLACSHPFYKDNTWHFIKVMSDYLCYLSIQTGIAKNYFDNASENMWDTEKSWYLSKLKSLLPSLSSDLLLKNVLDEENSLDGCFSDYTDISTFAVSSNITNPDANDFILVLKTQQIVKRMLFWIFDLSAPVLKELTAPERAWIYLHLFDDDLEIFKLDVTKCLFSTPISYGRATHKQDIYHAALRILYDEIDDKLDDFHLNPDNLHPEVLKSLANAADYIKDLSKEGFLEEYRITNLHQLLFLEILSMIHANKHIKKCKNCGVYFIVPNTKVEYCNRIAPGEEKTCQVIGPTRTFERKLETDYPLKIYKRAYNTHFARKQRVSGAMKHDQFDIWVTEAKERLEKVRAGGMAIQDFEKWLKK